MLLGPIDPKEWGFYLSIAQIGFEMVVPIGVGIALDAYCGWRPWGAIIGTVFGFVGGLTHLIVLVNRHDRAGPTKEQEHKR